MADQNLDMLPDDNKQQFDLNNDPFLYQNHKEKFIEDLRQFHTIRG